MIQKIAWLALAGALGTLARYGLAGLVQRLSWGSFPWGTLVVNLVGCFLAGLLWGMFEKRGVVTALPRVVLLVGFLGAFTTFSTMILETSEMLRASELMYATANLTLQNGIGLAALVAGTMLGRMI
jgi:CrcB protein